MSTSTSKALTLEYVLSVLAEAERKIEELEEEVEAKDEQIEELETYLVGCKVEWDEEVLALQGIIMKKVIE